MSGLTDFLRELTALLLLASVGELLIPRGKLSSVIHLVLGLAVIAVVLETLPSAPLSVPAFSLNRDVTEEQIIAEGDSLSRRLSKEAAGLYGDELNTVAAQAALSVSGITGAESAVSVEESGAVSDVALVLYGDTASMDTAALAVAKLFNLPADSVSWENGGEKIHGE